MSRIITEPTKWHVRPAKTQISLRIRPVWSESSLSAQPFCWFCRVKAQLYRFCSPVVSDSMLSIVASVVCTLVYIVVCTLVYIVVCTLVYIVVCTLSVHACTLFDAISQFVYKYLIYAWSSIFILVFESLIAWCVSQIFPEHAMCRKTFFIKAPIWIVSCLLLISSDRNWYFGGSFLIISGIWIASKQSDLLTEKYWRIDARHEISIWK